MFHITLHGRGTAVNQLLDGGADVIALFSEIVDTVLDSSDMEQEWSELEAKLNAASEQMNECIYENARIALDQTEYQKRFDFVKAGLELVTVQIDDKVVLKATIADFLKELQSLDGSVTKFETERFIRFVDYYTVYGKDDVRVTLKDGTEIKA